jgi:rhomboid protease GluP
MNRIKQLDICRKCVHHKTDTIEGTICTLTNRRADFEDECANFEMSSTTKHQKTSEKKIKRAMGLVAYKVDEILIEGLSENEIFVLAYHTLNELDWDIQTLSESHITAHTKFSRSSWGEIIHIHVYVGSIIINSHCTGTQLIDWGKNRKNIDAFSSMFEKITTEIDENIDIEEEYIELSKEFVNDEDDELNQYTSSENTGKFSFLSLLKPAQGYFITPILIYTNILIFVVMAISGVHILNPTTDNLLAWGANFRPMTMDGEWWRLISSTFLHIGTFHLLMNMYALFYIGLLLEPHLGKTRFLSAYFLSGIAGSVASIYWNELTISAGASGAIFGMYGVFLAMLTTNLIEKAERQKLLISISVFVLYNLVNGLKPGIDNAAHIGGLLSGILIGYALYPSLVKPQKQLKFITIGLLMGLIFLSSFFILKNTTNDIGKYTKDMELVAKLENKALGVYRLPQGASEEQILTEIETNGLESWNAIKKILENMDKYELPDMLISKMEVLKKYCEVRIKSYETLYRSVSENTTKYDEELEQYNIEIQQLLNEANQQDE